METTAGSSHPAAMPVTHAHDGVLRSARIVLGSKSRRLSAMIKRPLSLVTRRSPTTIAAAESSSCGSDVEADIDHRGNRLTDHEHDSVSVPGHSAVVAPVPPPAPVDTSPATPDVSVTTADIPAANNQETVPTSARLLSLPQELFDEIIKYLSPAGIVVLAMVNKELLAMFTSAVAAARPQLMPPPAKHPYGILGNYINDADHARSRYRGILLSILDMDLPALVYCYKCRRMHDPFVAFVDRLYAPSKSAKCADYDEDSHIPPRATRKMLRAITKHRLRGGDDYRPLLQQVNNTSTTFRGGHVVQVSLVMRYREDNMLLRRQQIVASIDKSPQALFLFRTQLLHASRPKNAGILKGIPRLRRPCNHLSWLDIYQKATDDLLDPLCMSGNDPSDTAKHRDHTPPCFSHDHRDLALETGNMISDGLSRPRQPRTGALGIVTGCDRCTTDVHLDIIALPEPYRWGFALTTWIDVGKIDLSKKWDSHRPDTGQHRDYPRDSEPKGSICRIFEDLGYDAQFEPSLSDLNQARLTNFGYVSTSAPAGSGPGSRLSSWSVEHAVDPVTGRLVDPDPLTEKDY